MIIGVEKIKTGLAIEILTTRKEWRQLRKGATILNITREGKKEYRIKLKMMK